MASERMFGAGERLRVLVFWLVSLSTWAYGRSQPSMVRRRSTVRFRKGAPGNRHFSKLLLVQFVAFVDRVMETLKRLECTGCPLLMTIGHFL